MSANRGDRSPTTRSAYEVATGGIAANTLDSVIPTASERASVAIRFGRACANCLSWRATALPEDRAEKTSLTRGTALAPFLPWAAVTDGAAAASTEIAAYTAPEAMGQKRKCIGGEVDEFPVQCSAIALVEIPRTAHIGPVLNIFAIIATAGATRAGSLFQPVAGTPFVAEIMDLKPIRRPANQG